MTEGGAEVCTSSECESFPPACALNDGINMREALIVRHIIVLSKCLKSPKAGGNPVVRKNTRKHFRIIHANGNSVSLEFKDLPIAARGGGIQ